MPVNQRIGCSNLDMNPCRLLGSVSALGMQSTSLYNELLPGADAVIILAHVHTELEGSAKAALTKSQKKFVPVD